MKGTQLIKVDSSGENEFEDYQGLPGLQGMIDKDN